MQDHYQTLGVNSSATQDEIRRAYRVLARRYHPDVNPGKSSEDKFKSIAAAYEVLSDSKKRADYDADYERIQIARFAEKFKETLRKAASTAAGAAKARTTTSHQKTHSTQKTKAPAQRNYQHWYKEARVAFKKQTSKIKRLFSKDKKSKSAAKLSSVSIIEVSVNMKEAIFGQKKTIEIPHETGTRKVSISIPAGVRSGSVVRLKQKSSKNSSEEIVLIIRVASHPFLALQSKGLVVEVPISVSEALYGTSITLPTLDEPAIVRLPEGSQSGHEVRIKSKGILQKDGTRGDIIYRFLIRVPASPKAVGLEPKARELDQYYDEPVRKSFPSSLTDI